MSHNLRYHKWKKKTMKERNLWNKSTLIVFSSLIISIWILPIDIKGNEGNYHKRKTKCGVLNFLPKFLRSLSSERTTRKLLLKKKCADLSFIRCNVNRYIYLSIYLSAFGLDWNIWMRTKYITLLLVSLKIFCYKGLLFQRLCFFFVVCYQICDDLLKTRI